MTSRIGRCLFLVALVVPFSGCPTPQVSVGVWFFNFTGAMPGSGYSIAVELFDDGTEQPPDPVPSGADATFNGTVTWSQDGSTFTLTQISGASVNVYTGRVRSSTSIVNGTWLDTGAGSNSGTWSGELL